MGLHCLGENALHVCGVATGGSQFQVLLIRLLTAGRQNHLPRLGIDLGLLNESLAFDVVGEGLRRIDLDSLISSHNLGIRVSHLREDHRFIRQVQTRRLRISRGGKAPNEAVWFRQSYEIPPTLNGYDLTGARIWFCLLYTSRCV